MQNTLSFDEIIEQCAQLEQYNDQDNKNRIIVQLYQKYQYINERYKDTTKLAQFQLLQLLNYFCLNHECTQLPSINYQYLNNYIFNLQLPFLQVKNGYDMTIALFLMKIITASLLNIQFTDNFKLSDISYMDWLQIFNHNLQHIQFVNLLNNTDFCECAIAHKVYDDTLYIYQHIPQANMQYSPQELVSNELSCLQSKNNSKNGYIVKSDSSSSAMCEYENYGGFQDFFNILRLDVNVAHNVLKDSNVQIYKGKARLPKSDSEADIFDLFIQININQGVESVVRLISALKCRSLQLNALNSSVYIELPNQQHLRRLSLTNCNISSLEDAYKLQSLHLQSCKVQNIELSNMNLTYILFRSCTLNNKTMRILKELISSKNDILCIIVEYTHTFAQTSLKDSEKEGAQQRSEIHATPQLVWNRNRQNVRQWLEE